ncbi:MAG TPA: DUF2461 domain-containing protein [Gemmatimonadaceae bacterium]|nr:DUF2461 domain-containing protein [Gemmatimonadaceae bacterium]
MPFTNAALRFFRGIKRNNNKQWFEANRTSYENDVRAPMRDLVEEMDVRFARFAPEICGDVKRSMFRINRDIRFSKDKSPYKTNAGCWFYHRAGSARVGSEASEGSAGFYLHVEPGKSFLGAGLWRPPRPQLNRLRQALAEKPEPFLRMVNALPKRFGGLDDEDALKRMPRGYAEDHPAAAWLRYQSFVTGRPVKDSEITSAKLPDILAREYEALLPLVRWLNGALGLRPASSR